MPEKRTVLITGASSGIGQATALLLAQRDFSVFGTTRNPSGVEPISGVEVLPLDVCSEESVNTCVDTVLKRVGGLDILVNNAGYGLTGVVEEVIMEEAKAQFETNFFGVVRMVKRVLPIMRRQGSGQIINIGSGLGLTALAFTGFYSSSKFALEGYTEALRHEVSPFQIRVSLVEPGFVQTKFRDNIQYARYPISDYDPWRQRAAKAVQKHREKGIEPARVAECILQIIESKSPRLRNIVGKEIARTYLLRRVLPESLFEHGARRYLNLDAKG
jgi:NAD(P)-dependent dehydrogenase (short-subunit alcohol dehydrogenase family)